MVVLDSVLGEELGVSEVPAPRSEPVQQIITKLTALGKGKDTISSYNFLRGLQVHTEDIR